MKRSRKSAKTVKRMSVKRSPGGGRKPGAFGKKIKLTLWLSPDIVEWIRSLRQSKERDNQSGQRDDIETVLRRCLSFVLWLARRTSGNSSKQQEESIETK